jgi:hypothetical protein
MKGITFVLGTCGLVISWGSMQIIGETLLQWCCEQWRTSHRGSVSRSVFRLYSLRGVFLASTPELCLANSEVTTAAPQYMAAVARAKMPAQL